MSLSSHLVELRRKHAVLEKKIEVAQRRPNPDWLSLQKLKREKLHFKDEIARLSSNQPPALQLNEGA